MDLLLSGRENRAWPSSRGRIAIASRAVGDWIFPESMSVLAGALYEGQPLDVEQAAGELRVNGDCSLVDEPSAPACRTCPMRLLDPAVFAGPALALAEHGDQP